VEGEPLAPHATTLPALLDAAATRAAQQPFLVERDAREVWHTLTFAQAAERSHHVAATLRGLGASARRAVMILAPNGIDHALVTLGAWRAGVPIVAVAPGASEGEVRAIAELVRPAVRFGGATLAAALPNVPELDLRRLVAHQPRDPETVDAETIARIVVRSGAPGEPRGVVVTHGMICALLQGLAQRWPFLTARPPVLVDALPWSGAFGGIVVLGIALRFGATLTIADDPSLRAQSAPTLAFDVPHGWSAWVARLRADDALRRRWLSRLDRAVWFGATLGASTRDALHALGVPLAGAWGAAETAGIAALALDGIPHDAIGTPLPGVELKLVADERGYEARVRGPQVTSGYYWRPDLTAAAFDDEGFFRIGDLVRPLDRRAPERGLAFAGRLDDRFKLSSGAWVDAAAVRNAFRTACPDVAEVVVTGANRDDIGVLVWPDPAQLLPRPLLRAQIVTALRRAGARRALIVDEPLSAAPRPALVARLEASEPDAEVIVG
jgi:feruloyl-CoA synthase